RRGFRPPSVVRSRQADSRCRRRHRRRRYGGRFCERRLGVGGGNRASGVGVEHPVIAVPTSVGYGASFGGLAALLSMLNSCAAGTTVVNIDNGFGAAVAARRIM